MYRIKYNNTYYKKGDMISIPIDYYFMSRRFSIKRKHKVDGIYSDCVAICTRGNKSTTITGSVYDKKSFKLEQRNDRIKKLLNQ